MLFRSQDSDEEEAEGSEEQGHEVLVGDDEDSSDDEDEEDQLDPSSEDLPLLGEKVSKGKNTSMCSKLPPWISSRRGISIWFI